MTLSYKASSNLSTMTLNYTLHLKVYNDVKPLYLLVTSATTLSNVTTPSSFATMLNYSTSLGSSAMTSANATNTPFSAFLLCSHQMCPFVSPTYIAAFLFLLVCAILAFEHTCTTCQYRRKARHPDKMKTYHSVPAGISHLWIGQPRPHRPAALRQRHASRYPHLIWCTPFNKDQCQFAQLCNARRLPTLNIARNMRLKMCPSATTSPFVPFFKCSPRWQYFNEFVSRRHLRPTIWAPFWCEDYARTINPYR